MSLSFTGLLFKRILITSGYTYNAKRPVTTSHLTTKYNDYEDRTHLETPEFHDSLKWLEENGYLTIKRNRRTKITRNTSGITDYIYVTEKGYSIANLYIHN